MVFVPCLWPKSLSRFSLLRRLHAAIQTAWSLSLCCCAARCSLVSVKKNWERINLFHFPRRGRRVSLTKPSEDPLWYATTLRAYFTFTPEPIGLRSQWYTPDKSWLKCFSARTKKISSSNGSDNGQEENEKKNNRYFFNRCLALHAIYLWLQIEIRDPSRFDNSTFSEKAFYFSLRIS